MTSNELPIAPGTHAGRRRQALPGPVHSSSGLPAAEAAVFTAVVPLLSIPLLIATMGAPWVLLGLLAVTGLVAWVCLARRVVIGRGWIADRRLWGYRVTHGADLRRTEFVHNGHGGVLRLHPGHGRAHRLREAEFGSVQARTALVGVVTGGSRSALQDVR
jgi:hypothetical protein